MQKYIIKVAYEVAQRMSECVCRILSSPHFAVAMVRVCWRPFNDHPKDKLAPFTNDLATFTHKHTCTSHWFANFLNLLSFIFLCWRSRVASAIFPHKCTSSSANKSVQLHVQEHMSVRVLWCEIKKAERICILCCRCNAEQYAQSVIVEVQSNQKWLTGGRQADR